MKWPYFRSINIDTYKLFLSLFLLALIGFLVWTAIKLFNHDMPYPFTPITGSILFLTELALFIWIAKELKRNAWRNPSFKLILLSLIVIFLIFAFAGVQPFLGYKDDIFNIIGTRVSALKQAAGSKQNMQTENVKWLTFGFSAEDIENDVLVKVNKARALNGLSALVRNNYMDELARQHCANMSNTGTLSHDGFDERANSITSALGAFSVGENCAEGYYGADSLVNGWLNSPGHRKNILDPSFRRTGIGYKDKYATQIFCD